MSEAPYLLPPNKTPGPYPKLPLRQGQAIYLPLVGAGLPDGVDLEADLAQRLVVQQVAAVEDEGLFYLPLWLFACVLGLDIGEERERVCVV